jgi:tRNA pseudouridine55 synthase
LETEINKTFSIEHVTEDLLIKVAKNLTGEILQKPPVYSAKRIDGERAYEAARRGDDIDIPAKKVIIQSFDITHINLPDVDFRITCSKGTYIRSIAHDFGEKLNAGAHLTALRRIRIGDFSVENAYSIESIVALINSL